MDVHSAIASVLAAGAGAFIGSGMLSSAGRDLYEQIKRWVKGRKSGDLDDALAKVEADPTSSDGRSALAVELGKNGIIGNSEIMALIRALASELAEQKLIAGDLVEGIVVQGNQNKSAGNGSAVVDAIKGDVRIDNRRIDAMQGVTEIGTVSQVIGAVGGSGNKISITQNFIGSAATEPAGRDARPSASQDRQESQPRRKTTEIAALNGRGPDPELKHYLVDSEVSAFVGAGLSMGAGLPGWYDLIAELAAEIDHKVPPREWVNGDHLIQAAQAYETGKGLQALIGRLNRRLHIAGKQPTAAHKALLRLPIRTIFTANFDGLLERAAESVGRQPCKVVKDADIPFMQQKPDTVNIVKLYGDLDQPATIVFTRASYERFFLERPQMLKLLETELGRGTMLQTSVNGDWARKLNAPTTRSIGGD